MMNAGGVKGEAAARLVAYLAFGSWMSEKSGRLVLGNQTLADIAGAPSLRPDGRWERGGPWESGKQFLTWARTWIPGLDVTEWNSGEGFAREVRASGFPSELAATVEAERLTPPHARVRPVHLITGRGFGTRIQKAHRAAERTSVEYRAAAQTSRRPADHLTTRLLRLTNGTPQTLLRSAVTPERLDEAYRIARAFDVPVQRQTAAHLEAISVTPKQVYQDVPNSTRIYPDGAGLNGLATEPRGVLLADLFKVDWAKAQFAVNAWLYGIGPVLDVLRGDGIQWRRFTAWLGLPDTDDADALVKRAIYALNYCAGDAEIIGTLTGFKPWLTGEGRHTPTGIDRATAESFLGEPLVKATREAMMGARTKVERDGGARDAFGNWIDLETVRASLASQPHKNPLNSVLAQVAQSWEVELMRPLVEILEEEAIKARPNVAVAVWLWDGAYLYVRKRADAPAHLARIKRACDRHAQTLGIPTFLELG
ncbi:MAG TPA: hypothetical protein VGB53_09405 [Rubricoccaceae bacterium]|jgi:hypothetical protein